VAKADKAHHGRYFAVNFRADRLDVSNAPMSPPVLAVPLDQCLPSSIRARVTPQKPGGPLRPPILLATGGS